MVHGEFLRFNKCLDEKNGQSHSLTDLGCESFDLDMQRLKDVKEILGRTAIVVTLALRNACTAAHFNAHVTAKIW